MPQCNICDKQISEDWSYCPYCGTNVDSKDYKEDRLQQIQYRWEREELGKIIYKNFKSVRTMGVLPYKKIKPIRPILGDKVNMLFSILRDISVIYYNVDNAREVYKKSKLIGYYSTCEAIKTLKLNQKVKLLDKPGLVWNLFYDKTIIEAQKDGWNNLNEGIINLEKIDKNGRHITYLVKESPSSIIKSSKPFCFAEVGVLCGEIEALSAGYWAGHESKCQCKGEPECRFELQFSDEDREPNIKLTKREVTSALEQIIDKIVKREKGLRPTMGDFLNMGGDQCSNYLLIAPSPGHRILSKHSGRICGELIGKKSRLEGVDSALIYLYDLFKFLKAGILEQPKYLKDGFTLEMAESVYASGADNIKSSVCVYLSGVIEGILCVSTTNNWVVDEIECIASGHDKCKFLCTQRE